MPALIAFSCFRPTMKRSTMASMLVASNEGASPSPSPWASAAGSRST